jgi:hypothetical protein
VESRDTLLRDRLVGHVELLYLARLVVLHLLEGVLTELFTSE